MFGCLFVFSFILFRRDDGDYTYQIVTFAPRLLDKLLSDFFKAVMRGRLAEREVLEKSHLVQLNERSIENLLPSGVDSYSSLAKNHRSDFINSGLRSSNGRTRPSAPRSLE